MANTLRYTANGDFNELDSRAINANLFADLTHGYTVEPGALYYSGTDTTDSDSSDLMDAVTNAPVFFDAGLYANFSENTAAVTLTGGLRGDVLLGGLSFDTLNGGDGNDVLEGGASGDVLDGGAGVDTASFEHSALRVFVFLDTNFAGGGDAAGDVLTNIENLRGSEFGDFLDGIEGGKSIIEGGGGADTIRTAASLSYAHSATGVHVDLSGVTANSGGDAEGDMITDVPGIFGSRFADELLGDSEINRLRGGGGDDVLTGGVGRDYTRGGFGADTFVFSSSADFARGGRDVILDFSGHDGQGDHIDLSGLGTLTFVDAFTGGGSGEVRAITTADGVQIVLVDTDGSGKADGSIRVDSADDLTADDFVFAAAPPTPSFAPVNGEAFTSAPEQVSLAHTFVEAAHTCEVFALI